MLVRDVMKQPVITMKKEDTIQNAIHLLKKHHIRHIPIINEEDNVIGIVSDRDIRDVSPSTLEQSTQANIFSEPISKIMTSPVITIHPNESFDEVASIFYDKEFACVPVVANQKLVGMVTEKDMLYTFIQFTGTSQPSTQIVVKVPDQVGVLTEISNIFTQRNIKIVSVYTYPLPATAGYKQLIFRIQTMNPIPVINDLKQSNYELIDPIREDSNEFM
ncbi:CBS and ACT domain-containing protein [Gracilibacillus marinus]|uniref:CBS and ACT domain-containing protein n=1 Tax=Gracilibacillus marinus TaxID=630535 RepID=A0ABV8VZG5_9BACI